MVLQEHNAPNVKWFGNHDPNIKVAHLEFKKVYYYKKCIIEALTLKVGDYVLVSNADSAEPDTVAGCDIAKILYLYELCENSNKDPCRAVVQWYSRPDCIPHKYFDDDSICIDFETEIIEEHRPYDSDISLETIFKKCSVITGSIRDLASALLDKNKITNNFAMFVCRYKFLKVKNTYRLIPLQLMEEAELETKNLNYKLRRKSFTASCESISSSKAVKNATPKKKSIQGSASKPYKPMPLSEQKKRSAKLGITFIDVNNLEYGDSNKTKVSPIKIVGGKSVIRLSASSTKKVSSSGKREVNANYLTNSPLSEKNENIRIRPTPKSVAARRNLNLTLENEANSTADSECFNYSIIKSSPDQPSTNEIKIKLRLSEKKTRRRSSRLDSAEDPLATNTDELNLNSQHKRLTNVGDIPNNTDIYETPLKKPRDLAATTPSSSRCKSILKSASTRIANGTPKRSIQLSGIIEQRIYQNDEDILATPKRLLSKKLKSNDVDDDTYTPEKMSTRTPRGRPKTHVASSPYNDSATMTPSQKYKLIRLGEIAPAIESRQSTLLSEPKSDLQLARERLHVSVIPKSLPCREVEFQNIYTFLEGKIQDQCGGCMYVSGVPGTGKTATVTGVIRTLQRESAEENLPNFEFIEINGMRLTEPRQAYVQIYKQLTGKTVSWEHAHSLLEKRFTTSAPRRTTTVLLVDELDILCNRRQDVVYNLLDWPTKLAARLVVITIANTMDLPERLLMGKVTSRLGLTRLTFKPYTHKQLQEIVTARLCGSQAFKGEAVQLVARKVAAVSGDARRALDICRRATEIADTCNTGLETKSVTMSHVQQALGEMIASAKVQAIKNCSRLEQIFLRAVVAEVMRTGVEETTFMSVYAQIETIAAFLGADVPNPGRALRICSKLGSERLIIGEHSRHDIFQKILLNVSMDDIHYALRVSD